MPRSERRSIALSLTSRHPRTAPFKKQNDVTTGNPRSGAVFQAQAEIIHRITLWAGSERQALAWYRGEPIPAFGGLTAENLVKNGKAAAVGDYLDHLERGGFA